MTRSRIPSAVDPLEPRLAFSHAAVVLKAKPTPKTTTPVRAVPSKPAPAKIGTTTKTAAVTTDGLQGTVYNDSDGDGVHQSTEPALPNVTVWLDLDRDGAYTAADVTAVADANGSFTFSNIPAGTWSLAVVPRPGKVLAAGTTASTVYAGSVNGGQTVLASSGTRLVGTVYSDVNANGVQDAGETGYGGVRVFIDADPNAATPAAGDPVVSTDSKGHYVFDNVTAAHGYLRVVVPDTLTRVVQPTWSTTSLPGDYTGVVAGPPVAYAPPGIVVFNYKADVNADGKQTTGVDSISNLFKIDAYFDLNRDGVYEPGEPAQVNGPNATFYGNVPAGKQLLRIVPPQGWKTSLTNDAEEVTVPAGASVVAGSFTLTPVASPAAVLTGRAAEDTDFDGVGSAAETAVPQVALWDDANANGVLDFGEAYTYTPATGNYAFTALAAGTHTVAYSTGSLGYTLAGGATGGSFAVTVAATPATRDLAFYATRRAVRVGGTVWFDANNNGVIDSADVPLPSVDVSLGYSTVGRCNTDGKFSILTSVGTYAPAARLPPGYTSVLKTTATTLKAGQAADAYALLLQGPTAALGTISGVAFSDKNLNGVRDAGEGPLAGVTVSVDVQHNASYGYTESSVTATDGSYSWPGLPPGTYSVQVDYENGPSGWFVSNATNNTTTVTLNGTDATGVNVGIGTGVSVGGVVWADYDAGGTWSLFDGRVAGATVFADLNGNGTPDAGEPASVSDSSGYYALVGLAANTPATIVVLPPAGYVASPSATVTVPGLAAGGGRQIDFFLHNGTGVIAGQGYYDFNQDGKIASAEAEPGLTIKLSDPVTGALLATSVTAALAGGEYYSFPGLAPGTYLLTMSVNGSDTREGGGGRLVTLGANQTLTDVNFGYYPSPVAYTGTVYNDPQHDRVGTNDVPIAGVRAFVDLNYNHLYDAGEPTALTNDQGVFTIDPVAYIYTRGYPDQVYVETPPGMAAEPGTANPVTAPPYPHGTVGVGTFTFAAVLPQTTPVIDVTIDDGTGQRSRVRSLTVTFSGTVPAAGIAAGAFALARTGGGVADVVLGVDSVTALTAERTAVRLTFSGAGVTAGALADGRYTLLIDGAKIHDAAGLPVDAAGTGVRGSARTVAFATMFGDGNGDGSVTIADFNRLAAAFNTSRGSPQFDAAFDSNGDDLIGIADFNALASRFNQSV